MLSWVKIFAKFYAVLSVKLAWRNFAFFGGIFFVHFGTLCHFYAVLLQIRFVVNYALFRLNIFCSNHVGVEKLSGRRHNRNSVIPFAHTKRFNVSHMQDFLNIRIFWCAGFVIRHKVSTLVMSEYFGMIQTPFLSNIYSHVVRNEWSKLLFSAIFNDTLYAMKITTCVAIK